MKIREYPYGFNLWLNKLWQLGLKLGMWNFSVIDYKQKIDKFSWINYFNWGLSPEEAIKMDLDEQ